MVSKRETLTLKVVEDRSLPERAETLGNELSLFCEIVIGYFRTKPHVQWEMGIFLAGDCRQSYLCD